MITLVSGRTDGPDEFRRWVQRPHDWLAVDCETTGLNPWHDTLRLVQFGSQTDSYVIPYPWGKELVEFGLTSAQTPFVGQNTKFDAQFLANAGHDVSAMVDDTKIMMHLLDSGNTTSLKPGAVRYLGEGADDSQTALKALMKKNKWTWATIPTEQFEYWYYAGEDTILTARLAEKLFPRVRDHYADLYDMETDVWLTMAAAERRGLRLDQAYCEEQATALRAAQDAIQAPYPFSLGGKKELVPALEDRGIRIGRTEMGNPSITDEVLTPFRGDELVDDVLEYRRLDKLAGTYFEPYLELVTPEGRVHPTINTLGARTGRMSGERPNLQNVPKRAEGDYVRRAFMPSEGHVFVLADYAQIEYRVFAAACGEPAMIQAFLDGKDMHAVTAEMALGYPVTKDMPERDFAKNGNFAEIYMAGLEKFAKTAGVTVAQAKDFKERYHAVFPRVKPFTRSVMKYAQRNGFAVETKFGRRIPVDRDHIYAAVNYMIQGTAADILKRAIVTLGGTEFASWLRLPIHDELIFDVPEELAPQLVAALPEIMEDRTTFPVPIEVEIKTQRRWGEEG